MRLPGQLTAVVARPPVFGARLASVDDSAARTVKGVSAYISMHMCFGNYRGRAVGWRSYRPLFPHLARAAVQPSREFTSNCAS